MSGIIHTAWIDCGFEGLARFMSQVQVVINYKALPTVSKRRFWSIPNCTICSMANLISCCSGVGKYELIFYSFKITAIPTLSYNPSSLPPIRMATLPYEQ
mmetsp:Transcript_56786/g.68323  ORF Transcript_56786/g.68323 Transcript_56786/m.68323 type:complete len:100 (+) Transcript_56786:798-1097(+)